jgi:hypothetical protein
MKKLSILGFSVAVLLGLSSCAKLPAGELTSAFETMSVVTEDTAVKLVTAKSDRDVAETLVAHAEKMKTPMLVIRKVRRKFSSMEESDAYKQGKIKAEQSSQKLYDAMEIVNKKYPNSQAILTAYGRMESIIKTAQDNASDK